VSDFNSTHNRAVWFDIPVADLDRASAFYRGLLAILWTRPSSTISPFACSSTAAAMAAA
jgi:predicted enzyme related to lactoylglutathione lyase